MIIAVSGHLEEPFLYFREKCPKIVRFFRHQCYNEFGFHRMNYANDKLKFLSEDSHAF